MKSVLVRHTTCPEQPCESWCELSTTTSTTAPTSPVHRKGQLAQELLMQRPKVCGTSSRQLASLHLVLDDWVTKANYLLSAVCNRYVPDSTTRRVTSSSSCTRGEALKDRGLGNSHLPLILSVPTFLESALTIRSLHVCGWIRWMDPRKANKNHTQEEFLPSRPSAVPLLANVL